MWKCVDCGAKANSKCVDERNIFLEDQAAAMLGIMLSVEVKESYGWKKEEYKEYVIKWDIEGSFEEAMAYMCKRMSQPGMVETLKIMSCNHRWYLEGDGKCLFGHDHSKENLYANQ